MNSDWYVLEGRVPRKATSEEEGFRGLPIEKRRVALDELPGGVVVSTVFLGLDHSWADDGPPILFETLIMGGPHSDHMVRYATWEEAERGHKVAVDLARAGAEP